MKRIMLLAILAIFCTSGYCQKKKPVKKVVTTTKTVTKTADGPTAGMIKNNYYLMIKNKGKMDTILLKKMANGKLPAESKVSVFTAKGTKLYNISWSEVEVTKSKLKTEEATTIFNEIWNVADKKRIFSNAQTTTKITQIHYLDKAESVSETQEKMRREGFVFSLTSDGDIVLKNKTQENKLTYNAAEKKYLESSSRR